jgi:hypothetical protein
MSLDFYLYAEDKDDNEIMVLHENITHNLGAIAEEAGIYEALWHPERIKAEHARDIIPHLSQGLLKLKTRPKHYKQFDSPNGWGTYEHFVLFVEDVLTGCKMYPSAKIDVSV